MTQAKYNATLQEQEAERMTNSVMQKFRQFGERAVKENSKEAEQLCKSLGDAYKNTVGKIILEYGNTIAPVYKAYGDLMGELQVNSACNETCAVKCWKPKKHEVINSQYILGFERTCFNACNCKFKFETSFNTTAGQQKINNYNNAIDNLEKQTNKLAQEAKSIVQPALDAFGDNAAKLQKDYLDTLKKSAIQDLGCDAKCVNVCTDSDYFEFWEVPACISDCKCTKVDSVLDISQGKYNLPQLALYADGNIEAWQLFKKNAF